MHKSLLFFSLLDQLVSRGDITQEMANEIRNGRYRFMTPELYVRAQLSFSSGNPQKLLDKTKSFAEGTIPIDKGRLNGGDIVLVTHASLKWDQIASASAAEAIYLNTKTGIQAGLLNASVYVKKNGNNVANIPVSKMLTEAAADRVDNVFYELENPILYTDKADIEIGLNYPTISGHSFTADTYAEIMLDGPGLSLK